MPRHEHPLTLLEKIKENTIIGDRDNGKEKANYSNKYNGKENGSYYDGKKMETTRMGYIGVLE